MASFTLARMKDSTVKNTQMKLNKNKGKIVDSLKEGRFLPDRDQFLKGEKDSYIYVFEGEGVF